jgi:hypothetical protein
VGGWTTLDTVRSRAPTTHGRVVVAAAAVAQSEKASEAERLAPLCRADGLRAGISEHDLEEAAGGDLVAFMGAALDAAEARSTDK